jgi:hypothetical protein
MLKGFAPDARREYAKMPKKAIAAGNMRFPMIALDLLG